MFRTSCESWRRLFLGYNDPERGLLHERHPRQEYLQSLYSGQPPWDIGKPQKAFVEIADKMSGSVLDAGCGTGDNALYFAERGCTVAGIDFLEEPITRAKKKAAERGV